MKELIKRIKDALQGDVTVTANVPSESIHVVSPDMLPDISQTSLPYIGIAPLATSEAWFSTGFMHFTHTVRLFIVQSFEVYETSIVGDSVKPSIFELLDYVKTVVRANFFASGGVNYLEKPALIVGVRYSTAPYGDNAYVFVASIDLQCIQSLQVTTK